MSGKFVRASKYRHVFGQAAKRELQYENIKVTNNAWDSNLIKTNGKFISVNWNSSGGGAFSVIPIEEVGKSPEQIPLFRGHTAHVLDTDFDPFNQRRLASGSDDSKIGIWDIPEDYSFHNYLDSNGDPKDIKPVKMLAGHSRKVGHVLYHPLAQDILASSSLDYTVKIWNVETGEVLFTLKHPDMVTSMSFSYNGAHLATVARDKKLRVWDVRKGEVVSEGTAHAGAKNQRVVWLGNSDRLATTGFSKLSDRQIGIWDAFHLENGDLGGFYTVDQSSGILMPFYDDSNKILYLAGKGDGNIRYYEFQNDELFELSEYQSTVAQRGFAVVPKYLVNIKENEVLRGFKTVVDQRIEPISFYVPRKSEEFQEDIYPDAPSDKPALTAEEWVSGKEVDGPILVSMKDVFDGCAPSFHAAEKSTLEVKEEKKEEPKKEEPKKEEPKKEEPQKKSPSPSASKESGTLSDRLGSDNSVGKLLQKASDLDTVNNTEDPAKDTSGWDDEDDKPRSPEPVVISKEPIKKQAEPVVKRPEEEPKQEPTSIATDRTEKTTDPVKPSEESKKTTPTPSSTAPPASTPAAKTASGGAKSMGLKQSVEKLSSLVLDLEQVVEKLTKANLDKDERLEALEKSMQQLLDKKN
ncbi:coronin KNAG_0B06450 [Huiozyma naganishii CBS 8797]|uniref:Coronin n=1 Tax=Huiozyma naganishii (strain ATCC MYA-139 / BCRC 22969 / CBS 8797 / KCTC 17520 / NBRC 10181 / NCYC 3082 / Yp74L-3) TaxID=1071383 RepID=J7RHQ4_HUIN7|nr:hypothetical protein KNAG_0B06450 [Kazachstania naganishii CBS 8797]CCK69073.1 hypothetical protein KNAG_0B06450 [Kazachstania naganishii CBS 8797]